MFQLPINKTFSQLNPDELDQIEGFKKDYWEKSRDRETSSIDDLSKYLWLSNGSGLTISFGLFQSKGALSQLQYYGCCSFVLGIFILLLMKIISEISASRDRSRFQSKYGEFVRGQATSDVLIEIRDKTTRVLGLTIGCMRYFSCATFIVGVSLFLISYK